jgi:hypothetical protein
VCMMQSKTKRFKHNAHQSIHKRKDKSIDFSCLLYIFQVVRPSGMEIAKAFWCKDAEKILSLRWDALAWLLNCAG